MSCAQMQQNLLEQQRQNADLNADNARLREQAASLEKERALVEKNFGELAATYRAQFADLASKILEEKSKGLESKNAEALKPLTLQLETFVKKVNDMERVTSEKQARLEKGLADVIKSTEKVDQSAVSLPTPLKARPSCAAAGARKPCAIFWTARASSAGWIILNRCPKKANA